ncbi:MAG: DUF177 domain-containing protein [Candidatus Andeanibacterium colombiense]|uniref:DUF177 domain-containing protein n=1 Tax=Candidatus Andeanibacterium colombiense TaxID=3121345 RepID=A0AAJ6BP36_9SPHN|nr:MAG: DUF177 domain-containing protein [Sphingomonadaceae bacterium]
MSEFSQMVELRSVDLRVRHLVADEGERAALAERFGLVSIGLLEADIELIADGAVVDATGTLRAEIVQSCAITGDDLPASIREKLVFRFVPEAEEPAEIDQEIDSSEIDELPYLGTSFDLGEAIAESLALAIDPYACGPNADAVRKEAGLLGEDDTGPFAVLKGLVKE